MYLKTSRIVRGLFNITKRCINITTEPEGAGLVLGIYDNGEFQGVNQVEFTKTADKFNKAIEGKLEELLRLSGRAPRAGEVRLFYGLVQEYPTVALVGLGSQCAGLNEEETIDEYKEAIRVAASAGCQTLAKLQFRKISIESFGHAESAAEGASLGLWIYQDLKREEKQMILPRIELFDDCSYTAWQIGLEKAAAQNLARQLTETPACILTPSTFAQKTVDILCKAGVNVDVKVTNWTKMMGMEGFLATARGSCEDPMFLEISYYGCEKDSPPVILVGKGTTFGSRGLCLDECEKLKDMRGDMNGAAIVVAACRAVAKLQIPINVKALLPLCENMPGAKGIKPGDVVKAMNGKTVVINGIDIDSRLSIADALVYADRLNPRCVIDIANFSNDAIDVVGTLPIIAFSNNDSLYDLMRTSSIHTGDRFYRLPLWEYFLDTIITDSRVDITSDGSALSPCPIAAFLSQFISPKTDWIHIETQNVFVTNGEEIKYLQEGMSGRPVRTVIEFMAQLGCIHEEGSSNENECK